MLSLSQSNMDEQSSHSCDSGIGHSSEHFPEVSDLSTTVKPLLLDLWGSGGQGCVRRTCAEGKRDKDQKRVW